MIAWFVVSSFLLPRRFFSQHLEVVVRKESPMASSSNAKQKRIVEDDEEEDEEQEEIMEELEGFDDFTLASSWERFISEIEAICRAWMVDGHKNLVQKGAEQLGSRTNLYKVKSEIKYSTKFYRIEHYFGVSSNGKAADWDDNLHDLQLSFGVSDFLVVAPVSASGVVLDAPESTKLLSAVAIALTNCGSNWPAFVPVHDPSRRAYIGIQNLGLIFTRRFDADRIASQVPVRLMHLEGLYELFISKFALYPMDFSASFFKVQFAMKLTYRTPPYESDDEIASIDPEDNESTKDTVILNHTKTQWDEDCPWTEWYSAEDPVAAFELLVIWSNKMFEGSLEMAELENASSFDAEKWLLYPIISPKMTNDVPGKFVGFASQLHLLVSALEKSYEAQFLEDFVSAENPASGSSTSSTVPPPTVVDRVLKEIFHDGGSLALKFENKNCRAVKGAPLESLFAQFCLHSLWFGGCNIHAIASLWIEFVREIRWCWDESQPLPNMPKDSSIDLSTCLIHQKLQMLAICIEKKSSHFDKSTENVNQIYDEKVNAATYPSKSVKDKNDCHPRTFLHQDPELSSSSSEKHTNTEEYPNSPTTNLQRKGSAGVVGSMMLLCSSQKMHVPYTQDAPIMTEDMHEERLRAVEASGDAFSFSGQLERDILSSDMSAFKAANPDAVFEDFIRWHSPGDWEDNKMKGSAGELNDWPPRGKLSQRMSEHGNLWRQIWNASPPLPISEQKPLLDPIREGEKILHYLETLKPYQLLEQMVCTAFRASADILNQTSCGDFKPMKTKLDQLYLTIASNLKCFQANHLLEKDELIGDLRRLCLVFEHIEKLLILAASIHRKLIEAPRLSEAVFNDYFAFYLPKMGNSLESICYDQEFKNKQLVMPYERNAVASLFPPPTANQSWRKVLSMGNLLNGHEPILREIIFSINDRIQDSHYATGIPTSSMEEIQTHRMYICGTSNDLWVALSVTSWD
ncbi:rab3 GTPase-activating protein catalytic subunit-like [Zingiber officinale]|uniref:rab3 GTPase-activating protein catalytic subunit-like n=1 Tax=Zingiber officinale TaxID=94328 RepID=UPI001C4DC585|nr:rab3 GTPase-activating protein catalytic subunit-like [Zingiber officinale]